MNSLWKRRPALRFARRFILAMAILLLFAGRSSPAGALEEGAGHPGDLLRLRAGEFDPLAGRALDAPRLEDLAVSPEQPDLWLVQFSGPIQDAWLEALAQNNLAVIQYVPDNAYLVWGRAAGLQRLAGQAPLRWQGNYLPEYALHPTLMDAAAGRRSHLADEKLPPVTALVVQVVSPPAGVGPDVQPILDAAVSQIRPPEAFQSVQVLRLNFPTHRLAWLAAQPGVLDVAPLPQYHKLDEIQGQIMAGNLNGAATGPGGTGYLSWLVSQGFSTHPDDYPIIDITDDGIDDGDSLPAHPDFYTLGDKTRADRLVYNQNWTGDAVADGRGGHGNLNASIAAGYNDLTGWIYQDPNGYRRGLGINPFGRVAGSKVFSNSGAWALYNSLNTLVERSYSLGARIISNSWGTPNNGKYTLDDQIYDALARDADPGQAGNQGIILMFAAGNSGPTTGSINSPGNAKNVITVGASENYRPNREAVEGDQCAFSPDQAEAEANNFQEIASFSSRGPTADGRIKPDLVAPGTTILGAATQTPGYWGEGICVRYYPAGQALYAASSGTSHSTPAVAGAASLLYYHYQVRHGQAPSPAMVKAYLVNSARALKGSNAGTNLPTREQGYGLVDLGRAFDATPRYSLDQTRVLAAPGEVYVVPGQINDPQKPLRITLAWTDAPGSTISAAYVNDLDLELEIDGQTYLGNVFKGEYAEPGGSPDFRNNVESIFLPAGLASAFTVRVKARNLAGDGVPGNADLTDQDFALVIYNASIESGLVQGNVRRLSDGAALAGASVWAETPDGRKLFTATQPNGVYSLGVYANTYTLNAWKYGYTQATISGIPVEANQTLTQDFNLAVAPVGTLRGCITDVDTGRGLAANVRILDPTGLTLREANTTTAAWCYQFDLAAGEYTLQASARLHTPKEIQVTVAGETVKDVPLAATTLDGLLIGQVVDALSGQPLAATPVTVEPGSRRQLTDGDGRFEFQLPSGSYTIWVDARFHAPVEPRGVIVYQSNQTEQNFSLATARLASTTNGQNAFFFKSVGEARYQIHLENTGDGALQFDAIERDVLPQVSDDPDAGEYVIVDSRVSAAAVYKWLDARDGQRYYITDDGWSSVTLPFVFEFYGGRYSEALVSNDGALTFNLGYGSIPYNNLPIRNFPDTLIAPFWDDFSASAGYIATKTFGEAPNRRFVIEWFDRPHWYSTEKATFEVVFYEGSNNLLFQYQDVEFSNREYDYGNSASIGVRSQQSQYVEYSFNSPAVSSGTALCFQVRGELPCSRVNLAWMKVEPSSGVLQPGEATDLTVTLTASPGGPMGALSGGVSLYTNDPLSQPFADFPLQFSLFFNGIYFPFVNR